MIERRIIDQIIDRAEIADVVGDFVTLHRKGRDYVGLCPFHDDSHPSFNVSVSKNICKCFVCGEGGTPLSFLMKHENLSFPEAIKYLGKKYGIQVIEQELSPEQEQRKSEREKLLNANNFARDKFANELQQGAEGRRIALSYFRERGLTDETIQNFELGYSPAEWDFLVKAAKNQGIDFTILEHLGLISKSKKGDWYDRYRERVIFPIHSISGNIVGFGGRILKKVEHVGKYINSPASDLYDKSNELYGLYFSKREISKKDKCLVVEGYMDVLSMFQRGIQNVVASSGTALTSQQVQLVKRYTSNITLIFDADNAGLSATLKGLDICLQKGMSVNILRLPEGEDPDTFAMTHTLEDIEDFISANEEDGIYFKERILTEQLGEEPQAKVQIIQEVSESISFIDDDIVREVYINNISTIVGLSVEALTQRINQIRQDRYEEERRAKAREIERQKNRQSADDSQQKSGTFTNLSTQAPFRGYQKVASKVKKPKLEHPLNVYEIELLKYLIHHGTRFIEAYELNSGVIGASVIDLIYDQTRDLEEKDVLTPAFSKLMDDLIEEQEVNPSFNPKTFIPSYDDPSILHFGNQIITEDNKLSPLHQSFVEEQESEQELEKLILKDITSYKNAVLENEIASLIKQINEACKNNDTDTGMSLLERLSELNRQKQTIANILGDRTLTPPKRIK